MCYIRLKMQKCLHSILTPREQWAVSQQATVSLMLELEICRLEKEMATHSVSLPGKSHGQRSLAGYSPWHRKELDTTE